MFHIAAWTTWALCAAVIALITRNPLYLSIIALSCWIVQMALRERDAAPRAWGGILKLGALVWVITIPMNALMVHEGTHALFRLPATMPLIGGVITLEAILAGAVSGLAIWTVLLVFVTYNMAVDATQLVRAMPPALLAAGTVASIALTFVPQMVSAAREIREAQQVRGHRFRGWRDSFPLFVPLLATAFEHALQLAESMEARGFGVARGTKVPASRSQIVLLGGLGCVLLGMITRAFWQPWAAWGTALLVLGVLVILQGLREAGRGLERSRYRRARWTGGDVMASVAAVMAAAIPLLIRVGAKLALTYYPYPPYPLAPAFDLRIGAALCLLVAPAFVEVINWAPQFVVADGAKEST